MTITAKKSQAKKILILEAIKEYIRKEKIAPTIRELCKMTGISSTDTVHGYLKHLRFEGYIKYKDNSYRTIVYVKDFELEL